MQLVQLVLPPDEAKLPAKQLGHTEAPMVDAYWPVAQDMQDGAPSE